MRIYALFIAAALSLPALAGVNAQRLNISDLAVLRSDNSLTVNLRINPASCKVKSEEKIKLTPAVIAGADTLRLDPITVAGKRAWYYEVRQDSENPLLLRAGKNDTVRYSRTFNFMPWMEVSRLEILTDTLTACECREGTESRGRESVPLAEMNYRQQTLTPKLQYIIPNDTAEKVFSLSGRADIRFMVNRTDIDWNYSRNRAELDSILSSLHAVENNPDATVREVLLTGYASPEGPYANNVRLAKGRTEVVKEYVKRHSSFPASVYHTDYVAEDWEGLKTWIVNNHMADSTDMIAFIDDPSIPVESRNDLFAKRFPETYPELLAIAYPTLRHTDYRITYNVRKYYDVEEIKRVMKTNPRNLSQNELYLVANTYPKDSREYFEAFSLAAHLFPDDATANLNAANAAMGCGDLAAAGMYLDRAGDSAKALYSRGILHALRHDYEATIPLLEKARDAGVEEAAEALLEIRKMQQARERGGVTIL